MANQKLILGTLGVGVAAMLGFLVYQIRGEDRGAQPPATSPTSAGASSGEASPPPSSTLRRGPPGDDASTSRQTTRRPGHVPSGTQIQTRSTQSIRGQAAVILKGCVDSERSTLEGQRLFVNLVAAAKAGRISATRVEVTGGDANAKDVVSCFTTGLEGLDLESTNEQPDGSFPVSLSLNIP